jgi:N-acetylglucosamine kinase-like BadF-type ATPase
MSAVADSTGTILQTKVLEHTPLFLHTTPVSKLHQGLFRLLSELGLNASDLEKSYVCIGMSGVTFDYHRNVILPSILNNKFGKMIDLNKLAVTGDAEIVFNAATPATSGTGIICHSGSTAFAVGCIDGVVNPVRIGGWGPVFGDDGSGYRLGEAVLREISREADRGAVPSKLWQRTEEWLNSNPLGALIDHASDWKMIQDQIQKSSFIIKDKRTLLYQMAHASQQQGPDSDYKSMNGLEAWRQIASSLVIPLIRAAEDEDALALELLETAARDLTLQHGLAFEAANERLFLKCPSPVILSGGVISNNPLFTRLLKEKLRQRYHKVELDFIDSWKSPLKPVCGALLFALGKSTTDCLKVPTMTVRQTLHQSASKFQGLMN